jgi:hypothetical protein
MGKAERKETISRKWADVSRRGRNIFEKRAALRPNKNRN